MDKKTKLALKENFIPPSSQKREQFINSISYPKAKFGEVFLSQIGFIRKRIWLLCILIVCFIFLYVNKVKITNNIISTVSAILPLFMLGVVSEVYKSYSYNMEEMEFCCKYNLQKIILMRFSILGTVGFIMLILAIVLANKNDFGFFRNAIYIAVPYLFSCYISLWVVSKFHTKETIYILAVVCGFVSLFIFLARTNYYFIYNIAFIHIWILAFVTLGILLIYTLIRFTKLQEELKWNFI